MCERSRTTPEMLRRKDVSKSTSATMGAASERRIVIPHAEEGEYGEDGLNYMGHMVAGSIAGMSEHAIMYPADTIKTRMQVTASRHQPQYGGVYNALSLILKNEGVFGIYRGVGAVLLGAIPGHAMHFAVYEAAKQRLGGSHTSSGRGSSHLQHMVADMMSGSAATLVHDGISTPVDVVKQRMQLYGSRKMYGDRLFECIQNIYKEGGVRQFYLSYPTTVAMNIPVFAVYFATYEKVKKTIAPHIATNLDEGTFNPQVHCVAGGMAGAIAAACSNPLDVIKTRLQTQVTSYEMSGEKKMEFSGPRQVVQHLMKTEGVRGFLRGVGARMLYQAPGAAVCWVTYEYMKHILESSLFGTFFLDDDDD